MYELIDTAPTVDHMNCILIFWKSTGKWHECYFDTDEEFQDRPKWWRSPECGWRSAGDMCIPRNQEDATHWQYMPEAPKP